MISDVVYTHLLYCTSSSVVQSNIYISRCLDNISYYTLVYPVIWCRSIAPPPQLQYHWAPFPFKPCIITTPWSTYFNPIWCKPVSPRITTNISRSVSMTEKSSAVRGANITDLSIAMVRDNFTIQTEVDIC